MQKRHYLSQEIWISLLRWICREEGTKWVRLILNTSTHTRTWSWKLEGRINFRSWNAYDFFHAAVSYDSRMRGWQRYLALYTLVASSFRRSTGRIMATTCFICQYFDSTCLPWVDMKLYFNLISGFGLLWCADSEWPTDDLDGILSLLLPCNLTLHLKIIFLSTIR